MQDTNGGGYSPAALMHHLSEVVSSAANGNTTTMGRELPGFGSGNEEPASPSDGVLLLILYYGLVNGTVVTSTTCILHTSDLESAHECSHLVYYL